MIPKFTVSGVNDYNPLSSVSRIRECDGGMLLVTSGSMILYNRERGFQRGK